jgi:glycine/D-amino acid oxidase-like deaminating enzyme
MSEKLNLRTGRAVWGAYRAPTVVTERLSRDIKTDILVVGMGISGAMIVEQLTAAGHMVVAIDRRGPLKGSTAATTALVQFEIDQPLTMLDSSLGPDKAARVWRRSRLAVFNLKARIDELQIACDCVTRRSLYLAGNVLSGSSLRGEAQRRTQAGLYATYLTRSELLQGYGIDRAGAIVSHDNLALDPRKLTAGFFNRSLERKARLFSPVEAQNFVHGTDGVSVTTASGPVISARHVILASGYELAPFVPAKDHRILSTWAIATRPQTRRIWPHEALIWEASAPYLYMRSTRDGRVICGGEDEEFADDEKRDALIAAKSVTLARKLKQLLPGLDTEPEFAWAGAFGSTPTGLPIIGKVPGKPRIHAVLGYGGNGITYSRIAAEAISAELSGRADADAELFGFHVD